MAELYLVEFKGSRKEYFYNTFYHKLGEEDYVVTQTDRGEDLGKILKKIDDLLSNYKKVFASYDKIAEYLYKRRFQSFTR